MLASGTVAMGAMCPLQPCAGAQQAGPAASGPGWEEYGQAGAQPPLCPPRGRAAAPSGQRLCSAAAGGVFQLAAHGGAPCSPTKPTSAIGAQQKYPTAPWLRCRLQDPGPASPAAVALAPNLLPLASVNKDRCGREGLHTYFVSLLCY